MHKVDKWIIPLKLQIFGNDTMIPQAVFFDFDGVVVETEDIKTAAFEALFEDRSPDELARITAYQRAGGGISRFEKFKYIHGEILNIPIDPAELARLGEAFSRRVLSSVLIAPMIAGVETALKSLLEKGIPAFVVSGTPHEELAHIVHERGLSGYFRETHGSPRKKPQIIRELSDKYNLDRSRCLFVGDAPADYAAAAETGTPFFGIVTGDRISPFPPGTPVSSNVADILSHGI